MIVPSFLQRVRRCAARFSRDERGNIAVIFAITLLPILGFIGAAVDYTRANNARSSMQAALDMAALMVSKDEATGNLTASQVTTKAQSYFNALYTNTDAQNVSVSATYSNTATLGANIVLTGSGQIQTQFMRVAGFPTMSFNTTATTAWGTTKLRVALVLDTTGSMDAAGKITALKSATKNLLDQLQATATTDGDVYVSIIPFSKNVNVNGSNYGANWIDWTDWESEPAVLTGSKPSNWYQFGPGNNCPLTNNSHGFGCAPSTATWQTTSIVPSSGNFKGLICPSMDVGTKNSTKVGIMYNGCYNSWTQCVGAACACTTTDSSICSCSGNGSGKTCKVNKSNYYEHTWRPSKTETYTPPLVLNNGDPYATPPHSTWNGCVTDRGTSSGPNNDYDRKVVAPTTGQPASQFPAEQNYYCSPAVNAQTYNWSTLKSAVDLLYPLGATNQSIGLVWGWQSLVGGGPLAAPPKDPNYNYADVIVLMSDGLNTLNRWSGDGSTTTTAVDARMYETATLGTCANIKAAGVTIYTLHVNTDGDQMSSLLKNCASSSDKFWMVTSASGIQTVFSTIGTNLTKLRIAK